MMFHRRRLLGSIAASAAAGLLPRHGWAQDTSPFRIGALPPITGAGAPYGTGMQKVMAAAIDAVNAAGGAAGRQLQLLTEDTETQPQSAVLAAKKLIEVNHVEAMIGIWSSGESLAVIPMTNAADMILMNTSGAPALSGPPVNAKGLSFRLQATNPQFGQAFAEVCKREGFKRPATMAFNNASGIGNADGFRAAWEKAGGTVVASVVYEPNQSSYAAELNKVLAGNPDVIVTGSYVPDTTIILRNWFETGASNKWILPGWAGNPELIKAVGPEVAEGLFSVESVSNVNSAAYKLYDAAYRQALGISGEGNTYAAMAYDEAVLIALAVQAAGPGATRDAINAKVRQVAGPGGTEVGSFTEGRDALPHGKIHYVGASSTLDFDKFGDVAPDFSVSEVTAGKLQRKYVVHP
jgi:branched-chain amino acid transport system substrate-binding protein